MGCAVIDGPNGKTISLAPGVHQKVADVGEAAAGVLGILSSFIPALLPFAAAAGVGTVTWKKMKTKLTQKETPLKLLVKVLEGIKSAEDPELWSEVKARIKKEHPSVEVERTIKNILREMKDEKA